MIAAVESVVVAVGDWVAGLLGLKAVVTAVLAVDWMRNTHISMA